MATPRFFLSFLVSMVACLLDLSGEVLTEEEVYEVRPGSVLGLAENGVHEQEVDLVVNVLGDVDGLGFTGDCVSLSGH